MSHPHLVAVYYNGEYKIAKRCSWESEPEERGIKVLDFLSNKMDRSKFLKRVAALEFLTEDKVDVLYRSSREMPYHLSRDIESNILQYVQDQEKYKLLKLINSIELVKNLLWCEWGYIIDFDKNTFEIYRGYNTTPLSKEDRFYYDGFSKTESWESGSYVTFYPMKHFHTFSLDNLPSEEEFIEIFSKRERL